MSLNSEDRITGVFVQGDIGILLGMEKPVPCLQSYTCVHICKQGIVSDLSRMQEGEIFNSGSHVALMKVFRLCKGILIVL